MAVGSNPGKTCFLFLMFFFHRDTLNHLEFQVSYIFMYHVYVKKLYSIEWRSSSIVQIIFYFLSLEIKQCILRLENNHTIKFIFYTNLKYLSICFYLRLYQSLRRLPC